MSATTRTVRIARTTVEATDIRSFELVPDAGTLIPFSAGSHIDVHVGGVVRQYSLCNDQRETDRYLIAVLRDANSRGGSAAMHALEAGQTLTISDPKNHFALAHEARHSLLFAGGIGITPILCMAQRLANVGASFDLHYCARSPERAAFSQRIRESSFADRASFHYDDGAPGQKLDAAQAIGLYGISKAGLAQLARNLALEWGPKGVRVNAISPGGHPHAIGPGHARRHRLHGTPPFPDTTAPRWRTR